MPACLTALCLMPGFDWQAASWVLGVQGIHTIVSHLITVQMHCHEGVLSLSPAEHLKPRVFIPSVGSLTTIMTHLFLPAQNCKSYDT